MIVSHAVAQAGALLVAVLGALVLGVLPLRPRPRAAALAALLVLTPALLLVTVWENHKLHPLRAHPALAVVGAVLALAVILSLGVLFDRRPMLFPLFTLVALPLRIPFGSGAERADLLLALYVVIGAGAVAQLHRLVRPRATGTPQTRRAGLLERGLAAFIVLYALQGLYTSDATKAVEQMTFFYAPFAVLFTLLRDVRWDRALLERCMRLLVALALLFVAVGLLEYATRRLLLNAPLSTALSNAQYFRVNSLFYDPNIYGRFVALTMVLLAAVMLWTSRRATVVRCAAVLAVLWCGLLVSVSQSSIAALIAGLALLAALRFGLRGSAAPLLLGGVLVVAVAALAAGAIHLNLGSASSANTSLNGRYSLVRGGLELFAKRPLAGFGSGSFSHEFAAHAYAGGASTTESHTTPVTVAAEQGVLGLLLYAFLIGVALRALLRGGVRRSVARAALAAAFAALLVHTLAYADFLEDPSSWALLAVGAVLATARE